MPASSSLSLRATIWNRLRPLSDGSGSLFLLVAVLTFTSGYSIAQQNVQVENFDGLLTVRANTSAQHLADVLAERLGITVVIAGDAETRVNIDIIEEPLEKALAKLSPNHLLVRKDKNAGSDIIEVVLMMSDDGATGLSTGESQFLPSGSPADDMVETDGSEQAMEIDQLQQLRDPDRAAMARQAASEASQAGTSEDYPPPELFDPVTGLPIDPETGLAEGQ